MVNHKKIAIISPFGAEPRLDHFAEFILAKKLLASGYDVHFYTYKIRSNLLYRENKIYQNVGIFRCRQRFGIAPGLFFSIIRFKPQIVIYFHPKNLLSFTAYLAAKFCGAKIISEIVGILHDPFIVRDVDNPPETIKPDVRLITNWKKFLKSFFSKNWLVAWQNFICHMPVAKADTIIAINKEEQYYIQKFYGRNSLLIHWGVPENLNIIQKKPEEKIYGKIPGNYFLFIAQIKKRKGWDTVIEALAILKNWGTKKNLIFVCPYQDVTEAKNYAEKLDVSNQISFLSNITNEEKKWLYANSQAVLAPSRYEGFGLPVFEALSAKKPVLATDIAVYQEILENGEDSLLSKAGDSEGLAKNIKLLDENPPLAKKLIANGLKTASKYTADIMTKKFLNEIERLTS